jgi:hypothetical protein
MSTLTLGHSSHRDLLGMWNAYLDLLCRRPPLTAEAFRLGLPRLLNDPFTGRMYVAIIYQLVAL